MILALLRFEARQHPWFGVTSRTDKNAPAVYTFSNEILGHISGTGK